MHKCKRSRFWSLLLVLLLCCSLFLGSVGSASAATDSDYGNLLFSMTGNEWNVLSGKKVGDGMFELAKPTPSSDNRALSLDINIPDSVDRRLDFTLLYYYKQTIGKGTSGNCTLSFNIVCFDSNDNELANYTVFSNKIAVTSSAQYASYSTSGNMEPFGFTAPEGTVKICFWLFTACPTYSNVIFKNLKLYGLNFNKKIIEEFGQVNSKLDKNNQLQQESNETQKGILQKIKELPETIGNKLTELFVPNEQKMQEIQDRFKKLLEDHLGFLYEAPQLVKQIFEKVSSFSPSESPQIVLPAFDFTLNGTHVHLWDTQIYKFDFLNSSPWSILYGIYKTFIFVLLAVAMINLGIKKYHSIIGGS